MNLKIGTVNDYNNMIQEATDDMKIGVNTQINSDIKKNTSTPTTSLKNSLNTLTTNTPTNSSTNTINTTNTTSLKNSLNTPTPKPTTDDVQQIDTLSHYYKKDIIMAGAIGLILFLYIY